jgi:DNA helicase-2/ATP-dependent DNA helicase PcrA
VGFSSLNVYIHGASAVASAFPSTEEMFLEQNYRSTAAILKACLAIITQGKV